MKKVSKRNWLISFRLLLMCLLFSGATLVTQVQGQENRRYISPQLQIGMHIKASINSPILELISSGSAVEVLKVDKDFSQIKTVTGAQGWVNNKFLTQEEPAALKVEKLELALQQAEQKQMDHTSNGVLSGSDPQNSGAAQLSQSQVARYEKTIAELKAELQAWEELDSQDRQIQKEQAAKINKDLKERLARIASLAIGKDVRISNTELPILDVLPETDDSVEQTLLMKIRKNLKKDYLIPLIVAGLGFFLGILVMDLFNRRRHGGFRV